MNGDAYKGLAIGMIAGAAIGLATALLYAPKSGAETRQMINDKVSDTVSRIKARCARVEEEETAS